MKISYRPEIDGLRAIAVGAVILYHSQITIFAFKPFKGGFIGVDIFFVISGYLITSIILKEVISTGSFSFKNFYERRVRRILPVLILVMLASLPFAWKYLLHNSFVDFSKSIIYSLGFISNLYFHYSGQLYGAENGLLKPFLHTWSLSVEEQFYVIFPIFLILTFKYLKKYLIHVLILGFLISLCFAEWTSRNYSSVSFYFIHTRMWELLAGSILAYFEIKIGHRNNHKNLSLILTTLGILLIGYSIIFFNDKIFHPSFLTLLPVIGVCLIIWFSNKDEIVTKILSTKLMVGIGLISYSLYLWHYPVFAFARENHFTEGSLYKKLLLAMIIIILSVISYHLVEKPFRNRKNKFQKIFFIVIIFYLILISFNFNVIFKNGFKNRFSHFFEGQLNELESKEILKNFTNEDIYNKNISFDIDQNKSNIFLIGDSHASTLSYGLWKNLKKDYNLNFSIFSGCQLILNVNRVNKQSLKSDRCTSKLQEERLQFINKTKNSIIILFGRLPLILNEERFNNFEYGFSEGKMDDFLQNDDNSLETKTERQAHIKVNYTSTIKEILKNNHNIILVYPMPEVGISVPKVIKNNILNGNFSELFLNEKLFTTSYKIYKERTKSSFKLLDSIKGKNIHRVYPHKLFCDTIIKDRCLTHDDKNIFYSDDDHPSLIGAKIINELILKEIKKIELKRK